MQVDGQSLDPAAVHLAHGKDCSSGDHPIADDRKPPKHTKDVATDRSVVFVRNGEPKVLVELTDVRAARNESLSRARMQRSFRVLRRVVLVEYLADDLLEQVFHCYHAGSSPVFIEHYCHVLLQPLEVVKN